MTTETGHTVDTTTRVEELAREAIADTELFLVEVRIRGRKGSQVVEVYIDGDSGVGVDQLASVSRQLSFLLESEDLIGGKYNLNVSSPGTERALQVPRQYKQHSGRTVEVRLGPEEPDGRQQTVRGELVSTSEEDVTLKIESGEQKKIRFRDIESASIVLPW